MPLTIRPATLADLAGLRELYLPLVWKALAIQFSRGRVCAIEDGEARVLAVAGLYPMETEAEAWFVPTNRGVLLNGNELPLLYAMRRLMREVVPPDLPIVASVKEGHERGARIARMLGFRADGEAMEGVGRWVRAPLASLSAVPASSPLEGSVDAPRKPLSSQAQDVIPAIGGE